MIHTSGLFLKKKTALLTSRPQGFTLIELMITAAILLITISGLLFVFINCVVLNQSNNNLVIAANDAQYVLEQVKSLAYNNIASYSPPVFNNLTNETITFTPSIGVKIAEVTVNVGWMERQRQRNFQLTTRIAK